MDKIDWLEVTITRFKSNGTYYDEFQLAVPNMIGMADRRAFLEDYIINGIDKPHYTYVCLDSGVLGFPLMVVATEGWYDEG